MKSTGVILYGPPTAGRRTITAALCADRGRFRQVSTVQPGSTVRAFQGPTADGTPVVSLDSVADVAAADRESLRWLRVLLWVPQAIVRARSAPCDPAETDALLRRWEAAYADLVAHPEMTWAVALRTDTLTPERVAEIIAEAADARRIPATRTVLLHRFLFR